MDNNTAVKPLLAYYEHSCGKDGKEYFFINIYLPGDDTPLSENIYIRPDSTTFKLFKALNILPREMKVK